MYNLSMVLLVILPIYFVMRGDDPGTRLRTFVIRSAALLFANFACLFLLFAPKVMHVLTNKEQGASQGLVFMNESSGGIKIVSSKKHPSAIVHSNTGTPGHSNSNITPGHTAQASFK